MRISYGDITRVYRKTHMVVMKVIPKIKITKLTYIENTIF